MTSGFGGDRPSRPERGERGERRERGPMSPKARLSDQKITIDYRDPRGLRYFITETGKVIPQRISGNCAKHQREVTTAIKRARQLALMPYASQHVS
jgi:small subunit ribosomal protein S18